MRVIAINAFGGAGRMQLLDMPVPKISAEEVLIQVKAAGVGMWDVAVRENRLGLGDEVLPFPITLGWECAGIIREVGTAVQGFAVGDAVYGYAYQKGTYAEYVAAPASAIAHKPAGIDFVSAAAVPVCGLTAHQALIADLRLQRGETILITGGAGGTGMFAIPIAAGLGARVITTSRVRNHDFLRRLGAHDVIDYSTTDFTTYIADLYPDGVDAALECVDGANFQRSLQTLRQDGRIASIVRWDAGLSIPPNLSVAYIIGRPDGGRLRALARMIDEGRLTIHIERVFPLEQVAEAHHLLESRHSPGKIVLSISE